MLRSQILLTLAALVVLAAVASTAAAPNKAHDANKIVRQQDKVVSCYYASWTFYRPGLGKFDIDDIDPNLCTHGFYGFAGMDNVTYEVFAYDPWFDLAPTDCDPGYCNYNGYRRFVKLKERNPDFVPMLSIGGWNYGSGAFSDMAADPAKRKTFIDSVMAFLPRFGFEGIDLDWEYPGSRPGSNVTADKEDFNLLVKEFSEALRPEGYLFTAAMPAGVDKLLPGYDVPFISDYFDFFNVMCYDFHGYFPPSHNFTGHNAPLMRREEENVEGHPGYRYNVFDAMNLYIDEGAPLDMIVMGMPAYGRGFHLEDPANNGLFCPAFDGSPMGPYSRQKGFYQYNEVLEAQTNDTIMWMPEATPHQWEITTDDCVMAPYMTNGPYWIGYDDPASIGYKVKYANLLNIRGVMIWSLESDDFGGYHNDNGDKYPLLSTMNEVLASGDTFDPDRTCGTAPICDVEIVPPEKRNH